MDPADQSAVLHANQSAFQCLAIVARFFHIPVDPKQLQREFGTTTRVKGAGTAARKKQLHNMTVHKATVHKATVHKATVQLSLIHI